MESTDFDRDFLRKQQKNSEKKEGLPFIDFETPVENLEGAIDTIISKINLETPKPKSNFFQKLSKKETKNKLSLTKEQLDKLTNMGDPSDGLTYLDFLDTIINDSDIRLATIKPDTNSAEAALNHIQNIEYNIGLYKPELINSLPMRLLTHKIDMEQTLDIEHGYPAGDPYLHPQRFRDIMKIDPTIEQKYMDFRGLVSQYVVGGWESNYIRFVPGYNESHSGQPNKPYYYARIMKNIKTLYAAGLIPEDDFQKITQGYTKIQELNNATGYGYIKSNIGSLRYSVSKEFRDIKLSGSSNYNKVEFDPLLRLEVNDKFKTSYKQLITKFLVPSQPNYVKTDKEEIVYDKETFECLKDMHKINLEDEAQVRVGLDKLEQYADQNYHKGILQAHSERHPYNHLTINLIEIYKMLYTAIKDIKSKEYLKAHPENLKSNEPKLDKAISFEKDNVIDV